MAVRSCILVWPQSHAVVEYTRDTGKASWQDARCENLRLSYAALLLLSQIGRYSNFPPSISLHRIPTLTARIRLSSVEREKEEGLAGVPNVERGLTATTFPVYLLGTWTDKKQLP